MRFPGVCAQVFPSAWASVRPAYLWCCFPFRQLGPPGGFFRRYSFGRYYTRCRGNFAGGRLRLEGDCVPGGERGLPFCGFCGIVTVFVVRIPVRFRQCLVWFCVPCKGFRHRRSRSVEPASRMEVDQAKSLPGRVRLEVRPRGDRSDPRGEYITTQIREFLDLPVHQVRTRDVYTLLVDASPAQLDEICSAFVNPVIRTGRIGVSVPSERMHWLVVVGYRPGVTDNVARSAASAISDILGRPLGEGESIYTSVEYLLEAPDLSRDQVRHIADGLLANELI